MSANRHSTCPRCRARKQAAAQAWLDQVKALYGDFDADEYTGQVGAPQANVVMLDEFRFDNADTEYLATLFVRACWVAAENAAAAAAAASTPEYPHQDGQLTVIGPGCVAAPDTGVVSWNGENYYRATDLPVLREGVAEAEEIPMPPGRWGRVEMPGRREHTGWLNDEPRYGADMLIVRDWDGGELAAVAIGPACRVVYLATPLNRPARAPLALSVTHDPWDVYEDVRDSEPIDRAPF